MAGDERWYFSKEEINNSPSRKCGVDAEKELSYRQQGAKLIQDMGQRLQVTQLVINTAIVYMHRFYMFHPFTKFHRNCIAPAALFLAAKVEEQPRKLEHVIKVAHYILCHHEHTNLDTQSETYMEKAQELVMNENILLQTLGFDVAIDHPHTHVVKCFQMVRTTTELAQTSYFMATNSLHMTTMCLQYKPAVVACVCIYIVCKWSNYEIQRFTEGKDWFVHVDPTVTLEMLEMLTSEFLAVLEKYPSRLKKLMNPGPHGGPSSNSFGDERTRHGSSLPMAMNMRPQSIGGSSSSVRSHDIPKSGSTKVSQPSGPSKTVLSHKEYSEKKEKERRERERAEHRAEKHSLPPSLTSSSSSSSSISSHHIPSSNAVSAHLPPHASHPRPQPTDAGIVRKPHTDSNRQPMIHGSSNRGTVMGSTFKEPNSIKREVSSASRGADDRLEKPERTSDNSVDSAKYINEKSSGDHRHTHSSEWNQSRHLDYVKDRKIETKASLKETRLAESRDHKTDLPSKVIESKVMPKTDPVVKVKTEKLDPKDDFKVASGLEDIRPNNSFIFNNNDFSLRDFLNPSAIPPDEIFDDDNEMDSKPMLELDHLLPVETTHHKLKSPPKPTAHISQPPVVPTISSSVSLKGSSSSSSNSSSNSKSLDSSQGSVEAVKASKHSAVVVVTPPTTAILTHGNHHSSQDKSLGNGLPTAPILVSSGHQNLQPPSSRKKDKGRSPHLSSTKAKHQSSSTEVTPAAFVAKAEDHKTLSAKESAIPSSQILPKDHPQIPGGQQRGIGAAAPSIPPLSSTKVEKAPAGGPVSLHQQQPPSLTTVKTIVTPFAEAPKLDASLSIRLPRPEKCDLNSVLPPSVAPSVPTFGSTTSGGAPAPGGTNSAPLAATVMVSSSSSIKKHKHDRGLHKHKEKKKRRHKEKDKYKERESKDRKEHKKMKKHKKHKGEKREDKPQGKMGDAPASHSLKITLLRNKGGATTISRTPGAAPAPAERDVPPSGGGINADTPGRIKLTIPKSRLQVNATPGSAQGSSSPKESAATPKVKLKLHRANKGERESRKRDRSPAESPHLVKIPRSSSATGYPAPPQVGKNLLLPLSPLSKTPFRGKRAAISPPHASHPPLPPTQPPPPDPHLSLPLPVAPSYPPHQSVLYRVDQFGIPVSMNYPTFPHFSGMSDPSPTRFPPGNHPASQYFSHFYTQYALPPVPNMNIPPPTVYQTSQFNVPPPGYSSQQPHQPRIPPSSSQASSNPPLPAGPPPKRPPTPPPE